ncbi:hypothetical protein DEJ28_10200 [Curtobacterium sp. MCPF17_002]|jgi:hypothetical protein|uniref:hypothetical protein n=1 Tax=Curtobacterium sp. MCPF17_002 TaxID=2175645 RepID=UPI000DA86E3B|nr:hypothetical protein [Curtobacterium sp. MCPF17_002]WIB76055.1 hypothetical protein DEJ28_10200 [Curtobacterium sp. MCPF17_002]
MPLFAPLPDRPQFVIDGDDHDDAVIIAWVEGATVEEWLEAERTGVTTLSMHVKWWWRRTRRVLR